MTHARAKLIYSLALVTTVITFVAFAALVAADAYVRWNFNQEFSFLGQFGMLAVAIAFTGQMAALVLSARSSE